MIELRNHTPHPIEIRRDGDVPVVLPSEAPLPRLTVTRRPGGRLDTRWGPIPLTVTTTTDTVTDLPEPRPGVHLIVARGIVDALPERRDLLFPDDVVRDEQGRVVACRTLGMHDSNRADPH